MARTNRTSGSFNDVDNSFSIRRTRHRQLYHCLQHRETFDEAKAFAAPLCSVAA